MPSIRDWPLRLVDVVGEGRNQYAPMEGVMELREQISAKLQASYGRRFDPQAEITVTCGGTEALYDAIQAVVGPGDEAIIFDPAYDAYEPAVRLAGRPLHTHGAGAPGVSLRLGSGPRAP